MNPLIEILPTIALAIPLLLFGLGIYLAVLAIKALRIYISKNS